MPRLPVKKTYKLYIAGGFPRSESGRTYEAQGANVARASRKDLRDAVRAAAPGDFHGIIGAARIDDDLLVGERGGGQAGVELRRGIARDHTEANGERCGHAPELRGARGSARG